MNQDFTKYPLLCKLADCIARFEGGGPGINNIGNIRCPVTNTAIWNHLATGETSGFCNFPSKSVALYALREKFYNICTSHGGPMSAYNYEGHIQFNIPLSENLTLYQMIQIYAPKSDGNDPLHYATTVAGWLGVGIDFVMKNFLLPPPKPVPPPPVPVSKAATPAQPIPAPITSDQAQQIAQSISLATKIIDWIKSLFS